MSRVNNIFTGEINGKTANDKYKEIANIDKSWGKLSVRLKKVNKLLADGFYDQYFTEYFDTAIDQESYLSEENNVSKLLSMLADFLINSDESKQLNEYNKTYYVFSETVENNKDKRHQQALDLLDHAERNNIEVLYVSTPKGVTKYKNDKTVILLDDLNPKNKMGECLQSYKDLLERLEKLIARDKAKRVKYNRHKSAVNDDMTLTKESFKGTYPRSLKTISTPAKHDAEPFDLYDIAVFKKVIASPRANPDDSDLVKDTNIDLDMIVKNCTELDESDKAFIELRRRGYSYSDIVKNYQLYDFTGDNYESYTNSLRKNKLVNLHKKVVRYLNKVGY